MVSIKKQVQELVNRMPEEATLEDYQYHLYVMQRIERSLKAAEDQGTLSQEQVEAEMRQWLQKFDGRRSPETT